MSRTYGSITNADGEWRIDCEPHVRIRLKRLFNKVRQQKGTLILSDTPEHAFELDWFCKRYPMQIEKPRALRRRVKEYSARKGAIERILCDASYTPPLFAGMVIPPREYQRQAADMLMRSGHLLLGDDVGIGKTASAICALTERQSLPALVVTLTHLPKQWQAEIGRFAPALRTHVLKSGTPYDLCAGPRGQSEPFPDVIITNYHKLARGWADTLSGVVKTVVFDEIQELRHNVSAKYAAATLISHAADFRMGLSATPIYNYGAEIHNVVSALAPDSLGNRNEFLAEWCTDGGDKARVAEPRALGTYLREHGLLLRRTRADVGRELPPLTKVPHHIEANFRALDTISASVAEIARTILEQTGMSGHERMRMSAELDWRLRQATGVAKAPYVADFVSMLVESGEQVVLYGWHHDVYSIWTERLAKHNPVLYTGKESVTQKEEAKRRFLEGDAKVLIMSLRAGAGLDGLQGAARTVVFGELDWSPGVHEQCMGRLHRDGQGDSVVAYFLIADEGSDPVIADVLGVKRAQIEGLRDPNGELFETSGDTSSHVRRLAEDFLRRHGGKKAAA